MKGGNKCIYESTFKNDDRLKNPDKFDYLPSQIYDVIAGIKDPEKPCSLEQLGVVQEELVELKYE